MRATCGPSFELFVSVVSGACRSATGRVLRTLLISLAAAFLLGGCCATGRLWSGVPGDVLALGPSSIDDAGVLRVVLRCDGDRRDLLVARLPADEGGEVVELRGRRTLDVTQDDIDAALAGAVHLRAETTVRPPSEAASSDEDTLRVFGHVCGRGSEGFDRCNLSDAFGAQQWLSLERAGGRRYRIDVPRGGDWSTATPYLATLATPVACALDVATAPIVFLYVAYTIGEGHECWVPWCR